MSPGTPTIYDRPETFDSYLKVTSEKAELARRFALRFSAPTEPVSLLDLGCNDGDLTLQCLTAVADRLPAGSRVTCVEPSAVALEKFRQRRLPPAVEFRFVPQSLEEFLGSTHEIFDWTLASHCLYWTKDLDQVIRRALAISRNLCVVLREKNGLYDVEEKLWHLVRSERGPMRTADEIESALRAAGATYERENVATSLPLPESGSPEFAQLVSFFLDTPMLPVSAREAAIEYFKPHGETFAYGIGFLWVTGGPRGN